tara:strand:- start:600 stop:776 length:177 start_codon:yes stop_codon:yes gene_type:complete
MEIFFYHHILMNSLFIETDPEGHVKVVYGVERVRELEEAKKTKPVKKAKKKAKKAKRK